MSEASGERRLAALRDEIRRSGKRTARLRQIAALAGVSAGPLLLLLGWFLVNGGFLAPLQALVVLGILGLLIGLGVGVPVSVAMFYERRKHLRLRLAELPQEEQLAVLLPLRGS